VGGRRLRDATLLIRDSEHSRHEPSLVGGSTCDFGAR
jgi:hypothetical protein